MRKKWLVLMLAGAMAAQSSIAFAAGSPSKPQYTTNSDSDDRSGSSSSTSTSTAVSNQVTVSTSGVVSAGAAAVVESTKVSETATLATVQTVSGARMQVLQDATKAAPEVKTASLVVEPGMTVNASGQVVVGGTTAVTFVASAAATGQQTADLSTFMNGVETAGYTAATNVQSIVITDVATGAAKAGGVEMSIMVESIPATATEVAIAFVNPLTGEKTLIPGVLDQATKTVRATFPVSGDFAVIYK